MAECKNCGSWCKEEYKYCWNCNQEEVDHPCIECGYIMHSERWKTICKQCYFDSLEGKVHKEREYKEETKQTRMNEFF